MTATKPCSAAALFARLPEVLAALRRNFVLPSWARDELVPFLEDQARIRQNRQAGAAKAREHIKRPPRPLAEPRAPVVDQPSPEDPAAAERRQEQERIERARQAAIIRSECERVAFQAARPQSRPRVLMGRGRC